MAKVTVKPGATLTSIAKANNTTVSAIAKANGITNVNSIKAGSTLTIPGASKPPAASSGTSKPPATSAGATKPPATSVGANKPPSTPNTAQANQTVAPPASAPVKAQPQGPQTYNDYSKFSAATPQVGDKIMKTDGSYDTVTKIVNGQPFMSNSKYDENYYNKFSENMNTAMAPAQPYIQAGQAGFVDKDGYGDPAAMEEAKSAGFDTAEGYGAYKTQQANIKALEDAKRQQAIASLQAARSNSMSALDKEKSGIDPQYQELERKSVASSESKAMSLAQFMAQRGLSSSGSAAQAELQRGMELQGEVANINSSKQGAYDDISKRGTDAEMAYNNGLASAEAGLGVESMQQQLAALSEARNYAQNASQFDKNMELQVAGLTGKFNGQDTLAGSSLKFDQDMAERNFELNEKSQDFQQAIAEAGLSGVYNGQKTIQGKQAAVDLATSKLNNDILKLQKEAAKIENKYKKQDILTNIAYKQAQIAALKRSGSSSGGSRSNGSSSSDANSYSDKDEAKNVIDNKIASLLKDGKGDAAVALLEQYASKYRGRYGKAAYDDTLSQIYKVMESKEYVNQNKWNNVIGVMTAGSK